MAVKNLQPLRVVVLDIHGNKVIPINQDGFPDMSHGDAVGSYVKKECPGATIEKRGAVNPITNRSYAA